MIEGRLSYGEKNIDTAKDARSTAALGCENHSTQPRAAVLHFETACEWCVLRVDIRGGRCVNGGATGAVRD